MITEKKVIFKASLEDIWQEIMDMESTIYCMPGVKSVKVDDANCYQITLEQKVSFIPIKLDMKLKITNYQPPRRLETSADATAAMGMGKAFQKQSLDLVAISKNKTELVYRGDMVLSGRMGTFGQRALASKTDSVAKEFLLNFIKKTGFEILP